MSLSNLPPGCLDSDIPGCRPIDIALDEAAEQKACVACVFHDICAQGHDKADCRYFKEMDDAILFAERIGQ